MITDLELERVAAAIERAFRRSGDAGGGGWPQVERLRLQSDLLDRLAASQRHGTGSLSRRAELVRDAAERLADQLNQVAADQGATATSQRSAQTRPKKSPATSGEQTDPPTDVSPSRASESDDHRIVRSAPPPPS